MTHIRPNPESITSRPFPYVASFKYNYHPSTEGIWFLKLFCKREYEHSDPISIQTKYKI